MLHDFDDFDDLAEYDLAEYVSASDLRALSAAIEVGDRAEARILLDRIFSCSDALTNAVQLGRYCRATQERKAA